MPLKRAVVTVILSLVAAVVMSQTALGATSAGTAIVNRAEATYVWQGARWQTASPWVTVMVRPVAGVTLSPTSAGQPEDAVFSPAFQLYVVPGQRAVVPFTLTNTGNGPDVFTLTPATRVTSGLWPLDDARVYNDVNNNGVVDGDDAAVTNLVLGAGESATLLLVVPIPMGAVAGVATYFLSLHALSQTDPQVFARDTWGRLVVVNEAPSLRVRRWAEVQSAEAQLAQVAHSPGGPVVVSDGSKLLHTVIVENVGSAPAYDSRFWDGVAESELVDFSAFGHDRGLAMKDTSWSLTSGGNADPRFTRSVSGEHGIEVVFGKLHPGQRVRLQYETTIDWNELQQTFEKTAEVFYEPFPGTGAGARSNTITFAKQAAYALKLAAKGAPAHDPRHDIRSPAYFGQRVSFPLAVTNTGAAPGTVELTVDSTVPPGWQLIFLEAEGATPLQDSNGNGTVDTGVVHPGQTYDFVAQLTVPGDADLVSRAPTVFSVVVSFLESPDVVDSVIVGVDDLQPAHDLWQSAYLAADGGAGVSPGERIRYALVFGNDSATDVYDVTVTIGLDDVLTFGAVLAGDYGAASWIADVLLDDPATLFEPLNMVPLAGSYDPLTHTVNFTIPHVPPGFGGKIVVGAAVAVTAGGGTPIVVRGGVTSDSPVGKIDTDVVRHTVVGDALHIDWFKIPSAVTIGDAVTYTLRLTNTNAHEHVVDVEVMFNVDTGLTVRPASIRDGNEPAAPLMWDGHRWRYVVSTVPAGGTATVSFQAVVNAMAQDAVAVGAQAVYGLATHEPRASTRHVWTHAPVQEGPWSDDGMILGFVHTATGDGVAGVRVVLDDGRYAITDGDGLFTMYDVENGRRYVRLDPGSLREIPGGHGGDAKALRAVIIVPAGGIGLVHFRLMTLSIDVVSFEEAIP